MLRIFKDTYRNVDTAEYCCSTGGFLWIVISCAEYLHAWIWWICVCLNFLWPPLLIYCDPSPISAPRESLNTTPKDSMLWKSPVSSWYVPQQNHISIIESPSLGTSESSRYRRREKQWPVIVVLFFWQSLTLKWTTPVWNKDPWHSQHWCVTVWHPDQLGVWSCQWSGAGDKNARAEKPTLSMRCACCLHPRHCHGEFAKQLKHRTQVVQRIEANEMDDEQ